MSDEPASPSSLVTAIRSRQSLAFEERANGNERTSERILETVDQLVAQLLDAVEAMSSRTRFVVVSECLGQEGDRRDILDAPDAESAAERVSRMREGEAKVCYVNSLAEELDSLWETSRTPAEEVERDFRENGSFLQGEDVDEPEQAKALSDLAARPPADRSR